MIIDTTPKIVERPILWCERYGCYKFLEVCEKCYWNKKCDEYLATKNDESTTKK